MKRLTEFEIFLIFKKKLFFFITLKFGCPWLVRSFQAKFIFFYHMKVKLRSPLEKVEMARKKNVEVDYKLILKFR